jgi:hypothetical protein
MVNDPGHNAAGEQPEVMAVSWCKWSPFDTSGVDVDTARMDDWETEHISHRAACPHR